MLGLIALFAVIGGGLTSLIPLLTNDPSSESGSLKAFLSQTGFFNQTGVHIIASLIWDLADKSLSVILSLILLRLIPERFCHYANLTWWLQSPVSMGELESVEKSRVTSLRVKVTTVGSG